MCIRLKCPWLVVPLLALLLTLLTLPVAAQTPCDSHPGRLADINTREQLKHFVHCAAAHVEMVGWQQAALDFEGSDWQDESVYLFAGADGAIFFIVGSGLPAGTDMTGVQDSDGVRIIREMERIATNFGEGYVYYRYENRVSGLEAPEVAFVKQMERDGAPALIGANYQPTDTHGTCHADVVRASLVYTERDVERFVGCAAHHLQQNGLQALHDFNSDARWNAGPTYLFLIDQQTLYMVADAGQPQLVGTDTTDLTDPGGVKLIQEMQRVLNSHDDGTIYYSFRNPVTNEEGYKSSYVQRLIIDGRPYILGAGLYVPAAVCRALPLARDIDTREELQLFVRCAAQLVEERGELAWDLFLNHPQWIGGSIYLFILDENCGYLASPYHQVSAGTGKCDFVDVEGTPVDQEIRARVTGAEGEGWISYVLRNPVSGQVEGKDSYVVGVTLNGELISVAAGLYETQMQE